MGCKVAWVRRCGSIVFLLEVAGVGELVALLVDIRECSIVVELFVFAFRVPFPAAVGGVCEFFNSFGRVRESMYLRLLTSVDDGIGFGHESFAKFRKGVADLYSCRGGDIGVAASDEGASDAHRVGNSDMGHVRWEKGIG